MQKSNLYRYPGEGGVIDSLILLEAPHELRFRLTADKGMTLTNGEITVDVIDVDADELELWSEIPAPEPEVEEAGEDE